MKVKSTSMRFQRKCFLSIGLLIFLTACVQPETKPELHVVYGRMPLLGVDGRYMMHHHEAGSFHPEDISCIDRTTEEQKTKWESLRNHPDGALFLITHIDAILAIVRDMADQGDPVGMYAFGGLKREFLSTEYGRMVSRTESKIMPEHERKDMVIALTYAYASTYVKDLGQKEGMLTNIEKGGYDVDIPPEWIAEAKENAARWRKHCESGAK